MGEVLGRSEVRRASHKAPHVPIAATPAVSMFNERLHVDLLFPRDLIAQRVMDVCGGCFLQHAMDTRAFEEPHGDLGRLL